MPKIPRGLYKRNKELTLSALHFYSKLLNAFGWNSGRMRKTLEDMPLRDPPRRRGKPVWHRKPSIAAVAPPGDDSSSTEATGGMTMQLQQSIDVLIADIASNLKTVQNKTGRRLFHALRNNGARAKGFSTLQELFHEVAVSHGEGWREEYLTVK